MAHRFLFVMDPLSQVLVDKDTTFAFMLEAVARKHPELAKYVRVTDVREPVDLLKR